MGKENLENESRTDWQIVDYARLVSKLEKQCSEWNDCFEEVDSKNEEAVELGIRHGGHDGEHHKTWVIDQMLRILLGDDYDETIAYSCKDEDGNIVYEHDCGIAP